ncbi:hypothetical protein [Entomospira culicis]|uniref:Secreted protein n=1 Tax=Entomospira culicis TaxID=2719989 RepID=A0A968GF52_9SPIO|nr:hypothetical protein [Entomospira culicis]NIZ18663.1 hypothetical protein [Entomospira culicis]NIZ68878.1 hypothetical protein [Entomospira culicis]WDI37471.1 hypothetical protein PVA46_01400 [Entomospira culicis]WDI39099.1 hypothetical protein PVA47_01405 [Entomospira culicis]
MKKIVLICLFSMIGLSTVQARVGVGALWGTSASYRGWGVGNGFGLSVGIGEIGAKGNWDFGLRFWGGSGHFILHTQADWIFLELNFTDWFGLYGGVGPYVGMNFFSDGAQFDLGGRLPLGLRFMFFDRLDLWLAFVPSVGVGFGSGGVGLGGGLGGEFGIRFWF